MAGKRYFSECSVASSKYLELGVACLYQDGSMTGKMFCHQTGESKTGWAYKLESL